MGRPTILSVAALVGTLFVALVLSSLLSLLQIGALFFVAFYLSRRRQALINHEFMIVSQVVESIWVSSGLLIVIELEICEIVCLSTSYGCIN